MKSLLLTLAVTLSAVISHANPPTEIRIPVSKFDPKVLEDAQTDDTSKWSKLKLPKRSETTYKQAVVDKRDAIQAISRGSASGLLYQISIDPNEYPIIEWSWYVEGPVKNGDLTKKSGDDYAARLYLTFEYEKSQLSFGDRLKYAFIKTFTSLDIPLRSLNYIWATKAEKGTIAPNPYTKWVYMIAVDSGKDGAKNWVSYQRDLVKDFKEAFDEIPRNITGVAIMTDSDDTKTESSAYYGDIVFKKR